MLVYVPHTTAGLTINEHADPLVARDFEMALERIAPEGWGWQHIEEGEENAPSHVRAALMGPQVLIPLRDGELALGTWQGIFFCELDGPRTRSVLRHRAAVAREQQRTRCLALLRARHRRSAARAARLPPQGRTLITLPVPG